MTTGEIIKNLRIKLNMTQEELGEKIGVQKSAIAKYENGRVINFKTSTLLKIATALQTSPNTLLNWENEKNPIENVDLKKELDKLKFTIENHKNLIFNGKPLQEKNKKIFLLILKQQETLIEELNNTFFPK